MKRSEIAQLLAAVAATDNRTVGKLDVETWAQILPEEITLADAHAALVNHRRTSIEWFTPKHVIDFVGAERRERLRRAGTPPIPGDLTYADEQAWRQLWCAAVKAGDPDPAGVANRAMRIPPELAVVTFDAAEREQLIAKLAESKAIPKTKSRRKRIAFVDDTKTAS